MWPGAPVESTMFNHFEITFDLIDGKVTAHTAAKGIKGESLFSHEFDLNEPKPSPAVV